MTPSQIFSLDKESIYMWFSNIRESLNPRSSEDDLDSKEFGLEAVTPDETKEILGLKAKGQSKLLIQTQKILYMQLKPSSNEELSYIGWATKYLLSKSLVCHSKNGFNGG